MLKLTNRELEVIELLIKGLDNAEIGEILSVSEHTAKAHIASIYKKFNVKNRVQAAVYYIEYKLKMELESQPERNIRHAVNM